MPTIYHGTPLTPDVAFKNVMAGRSAFVSFFRPDQAALAEELCPRIGWDNGAFSSWRTAVKRGEEWDDGPRDWGPYYAWLEPRLKPGRWAVIPDSPGAPSQLNDALLKDWPFGRSWGVPLWHMDGPLERLGRLCEAFDRVALGWIGDPKQEPVGCPRYRDRMEEVDRLLGNRWPPLHMMRGVAVAHDYWFASADSTSLAQNGHRYDCALDFDDPWWGRRSYADKLERNPYTGRLRGQSPGTLARARRNGPPRARRPSDEPLEQSWLW